MAKDKKTEEQNPLEAEILREVAEEMKEEQAKKLWKKIAPWLMSAVVVALAATGGFEYTQYRSRQQAQADAAALQDALAAVQSGQIMQGAERLKALRDSSTSGYRSLAGLYYVDTLLKDGNINGALDGLDFVANDKKAPEALRSLAVLNKVSIAVDGDNPDYDGLNADLDEVLKREDAWTADALELRALIALRQGDAEKAQSCFKQIMALPNANEAKKLRASENLNLLQQKTEAEQAQ